MPDSGGMYEVHVYKTKDQLGREEAIRRRMGKLIKRVKRKQKNIDKRFEKESHKGL